MGESKSQRWTLLGCFAHAWYTDHQSHDLENRLSWQITSSSVFVLTSNLQTKKQLRTCCFHCASQMKTCNDMFRWFLFILIYLPTVLLPLLEIVIADCYLRFSAEFFSTISLVHPPFIFHQRGLSEYHFWKSCCRGQVIHVMSRCSQYQSALARQDSTVRFLLDWLQSKLCCCKKSRATSSNLSRVSSYEV